MHKHHMDRPLVKEVEVWKGKNKKYDIELIFRIVVHKREARNAIVRDGLKYPWFETFTRFHNSSRAWANIE